VGDSKLRFGIISYSNLRHAAGVENWIAEVVERLSNHSWTIVTSDSGSKFSSQVYDRVTRSGARVIEIPLLPPYGFPSPSTLHRFAEVFGGADAVYFYYMGLGLRLSSLLFAELSSTPLIAGHHNWVDYGRARWSERFGLKRFNAHHALNREHEEQLKSLGAPNVYRIGNGVHCAQFRPADKGDLFSVLFVGRLDRGKGVDLLPAIVSSLRSEIGSQFVFHVVGGGRTKEAEEAKRLIGGCGRVVWHGYVSEDEKRELYASSHVLVAPSRMEAFPLVGLEAMASGTPVVASDIPGPREYVRDGFNGYLVRDVKEMVERVVEVYSLWRRGDSAYYDLCGNARRTAEVFDWGRVVPRLERMFREVAGGGR